MEVPTEQFEKIYYTTNQMAKNTKEYFDSLPEKEIPTEQLATKEELLELEKRLLVLERELQEVKYRSERVTDKNSTNSYIAGV